MGPTSKNCDVHLYAEIEILKQALVNKQNELIAMETTCLRETDRQAELEDSIIAWQDKYDRLYESHKRVQKVNQTLEDKLLKLVDRNSGERAQLTSDVATLSVRLAQANYNIATLQREIVSTFSSFTIYNNFEIYCFTLLPYLITLNSLNHLLNKKLFCLLLLINSFNYFKLLKFILHKFTCYNYFQILTVLSGNDIVFFLSTCHRPFVCLLCNSCLFNISQDIVQRIFLFQNQFRTDKVEYPF